MANEKQDRYLHLRGGYWHYQRHVPKKFSHVDSRILVRKTLGTKNINDARQKRDALVEADNKYWNALALEAVNSNGVSARTFAIEKQKYAAATARAVVYGFEYKTVDKLVSEKNVGEILERIEALQSQLHKNDLPKKKEVFALLGGVSEPTPKKTLVSEAFKLYLERISFDDQYNKSPRQKYVWEKTKRTSINYFIEKIGDLNMEDITREQAQRYRDWWMDRMVESKGLYRKQVSMP